MPEFLVELYVARGECSDVAEPAERARRAAIHLTRRGNPVAFLRSILVPEDETCFLLFEARSAADVRAAGSLAGLAFDRIAEAVLAPPAIAAQE